ncbi:MAG TPA: hypothetical protein ENK88_09380 [Campylobacterales bacterium]|nr:hypothetical protein [Campylobacterales bacterium]
MKKLVVASILASSVLFAAGPIQLGVTSSNNIAGITSAKHGSAIKQGSVEVYGNSEVKNPVGPLLPNVVAVNGVVGAVIADNNSTVEQGTLQISDSKVSILKTEGNLMAAGAIAKDNSEISQGKWKIVDVHGRSSIKTIAQTNLMGALASARYDSKITQGNIEVGSVDNVNVTVTAVPVIGGNKLVGLIDASNGSAVEQGSVKICGNTHLAHCGN